MDKETTEEAVLESEEDLQRMIELGAWYDGDWESNVATVEADSDTGPIYNRNEVLKISTIHAHLSNLMVLGYYIMKSVVSCLLHTVSISLETCAV